MNSDKLEDPQMRMGNVADDRWTGTSTAYVAPRTPGSPDAWTEETGGGQRGTQEIVYAGETVPVPGVAAMLGLDDGESAVVRRRVMRLDQRVVELTDTYYPTAIARGTELAEPRKIPGGAITLLASLGHRGARIIEDVTASLPEHKEREALALDEGEAVLILRRLTLDDTDRPIQADVMTMPARTRRLRYELKVD